MKKLLGLLLMTVLIAGSLFAAGGKDSAAAEENKMVVVKTMAYGDNSNSEGVNWVRVVNTFHENNPNIKIDFEMLYDEAYHQKVVARLASGDVPHLAYMGADARWGAPWKEAGQQYDHRDIIDSSFYDLNLIPPMGPNGEIYEIPLGTSNITTVLYMNKALVEELGFSQPKTYADLKAMVPAAKAAGLEVVSIDGADGWAWGSCLMSVMAARTSGDPQWVSKAVDGQFKFTDKEFVSALEYIEMMVNDGVISSKSVLVDYGTNISNFSNKKALFMVQGQWAAGGIENPEVSDNTVMMAWPEMPGEKSSTNGSVAAAIQVGYGLTKAGAADPEVKDAAMKFLSVFYSEPETTQRLRDGAIVAPILKGYTVPSDLPAIMKEKVALAQKALNTDVIDAYLSGAPNDALNAGMQKIASGQATAAQIAAEVEGLLR
ncbi:extracellular solute-binding protein [Oceanispirochaeta crateris]|uniref:Extracellular solute-binding protein n=1 Tax=Oceanispirochaeta crateris TaxID=2518645 RepID=A0A5C1QJ05_9SPIO|nr:extracellular solute-binding protein [Oceanispirochaeta crateris]QEN07030.1 extracellular solute-binding protein [Oceanispirochaeta crateris]